MFINILIVVCVSGAIALGLKMLFPRRGKMMPILIASLVPPPIVVAVGFYRMLVNIGRHADEHGAGPPNMVDDFASGFGGLLQLGMIWPFVAVPVGFAVLYLYRRVRA